VNGEQPVTAASVHASADPETWPPMDRFLAAAMNNFSGIPSEGLEPLYVADATVRVGIPSYVELEGRIRSVPAGDFTTKFLQPLCRFSYNLKNNGILTCSAMSLSGVKNFQHYGSYSPEGGRLLYLFTEYNNVTLTGKASRG